MCIGHSCNTYNNDYQYTSGAPAAAITSGREPGYQLTVKVPSYPFGTSTLGISITTANGYTDQASIAASGVTSWTFNIPASQGSSVRVCVNSTILLEKTVIRITPRCRYVTITISAIR